MGGKANEVAVPGRHSFFPVWEDLGCVNWARIRLEFLEYSSGFSGRRGPEGGAGKKDIRTCTLYRVEGQ